MLGVSLASEPLTRMLPFPRRDATAGDPSTPMIVGSSAAIQQVVALAKRIAAGSVKVLITGESGTGKDVLARFIHSQSSRAAEPLIALNCAGISEALLESELFGHVKGSFTGAYRDKAGLMERAHRGSVFLDEIGDMSLRMQALLLRFLETGELQRVGSDAPVTRVDVRVISATNRNLAQMVDKGEFREDLLYRVNVVHLHVPPLRERVVDIRPLSEHIIAKCGASLTLGDEAMKLLERYPWPGNVRELQNIIERLASTVSGRTVEPDDLPPAVLAHQPGHADRRRERRRSVADDLYDGLVAGGFRFWEDIHTLFTNRDITRVDLRRLIRRGLSSTSGNYRGLLQLFGMEQQDYKRLLNFLAAHDCIIDFREFRSSKTKTETEATSRSRTPSAAR
jgi:transcriptional regulator with PAS, ATPase and Fis domain